MTFGEHLLLYRRRQKLTLTKMSKQIGVPRQYLSEIERDIRNPNDQQKSKLVKLFPELLDNNKSR